MDKSKKGRSSRNKGAQGERELVHYLNEAHGLETSRGMVFLRQPDLIGLEGIHIECKRQETMRLYDWMKQSIEASNNKHDGLPVVMHRKNREQWLVTMTLDDWVEIYKAWRWAYEKADEVRDEQSRLLHEDFD